MKRNIQNQGITLIALVVTIVVLLILAGITISMLFSENGIITKAQQAAEETKESEENETKGMQNVAEEINQLLNQNNNDADSYEPDEWDVAWTCTDGIWSDEIPAGTIISDDVDIIAKFYKKDNIIMPPSLIFNNTEYPFKEGNEYKLVIEGQGEMGTLMTTEGATITEGYAWQFQSAAFMAGYTDTCILPYVTEITIGDGITKIGDYAFMGNTALEKVTIGKDVINIGEFAFSHEFSIKSITIPEAVNTISSVAFWNCKSLEKIKILATDADNLSIGSGVFDEIASNSVIYVLNEEIKTKLEKECNTNITTVQVVTKEEMDNL